MPETPTTTAACCPVHQLGKCDAVFTCCDRCPTFFGDRPVVTSPESASGRDSDRYATVRGSATTAQVGDAALPWEWRLAYNHSFMDQNGRATFHAHDVNHNAACEPMWGLVTSTDEPNEGSFLCPRCMEIVRRQPQGRPKREVKSA